jgi:hypothetical protein|tara:strand:+ start:550 stop:825 length:276 start_codon:yes stop_codon:yes gene_type:complete
MSTPIWGTLRQLPGASTYNIRDAKSWVILAVVGKPEAIDYVNVFNERGLDVLVERTNGTKFPSGEWALRFNAESFGVPDMAPGGSPFVAAS